MWVSIMRLVIALICLPISIILILSVSGIIDVSSYSDSFIVTTDSGTTLTISHQDQPIDATATATSSLATE